MYRYKSLEQGSGRSHWLHRLQLTFPPIQAEPAEDNRCAANEGIVWSNVRLKETNSQTVRSVCIGVERDSKGKGEVSLVAGQQGGKRSRC